MEIFQLFFKLLTHHLKSMCPIIDNISWSYYFLYNIIIFSPFLQKEEVKHVVKKVSHSVKGSMSREPAKELAYYLLTKKIHKLLFFHCRNEFWKIK